LRVRDRGPGIRRRDAKRIFRPFHRSARRAAGGTPGVGLGLALSRRLARRLGGELRWVPSEEGAVFELELANLSTAEGNRGTSKPARSFPRPGADKLPPYVSFLSLVW